MKCRARANGDIVELDAEVARPLIEAGIYEAVEEAQAGPSTAAAVPKPEPASPVQRPERRRARGKR